VMLAATMVHPFRIGMSPHYPMPKNLPHVSRPHFNGPTAPLSPRRFRLLKPSNDPKGSDLAGLDWERPTPNISCADRKQYKTEALEFADGAVRSPTRTTVRSWKEMHERYRPRRVRQDPAGLDEMRAKLGPDR
jgi:hypothetical protein